MVAVRVIVLSAREEMGLCLGARGCGGEHAGAGSGRVEHGVVGDMEVTLQVVCHGEHGLDLIETGGPGG